MLDHAAGRRARVVDHDVDAAERLVRLGDEILRIQVLSEIRRDGDDLAVRLAGNRRGRFLERPGPARADGNVDAFAREAERDAASDPLAPAGHQRGLALKPEIHNSPPGWQNSFVYERC